MQENRKDPYGFEPIFPAFNTDNVPVVFATDNNYIPFLSVALTSLVEHCDANTNYDVIISATDVQDYNKRRIEGIAKGRSNVSIRWYDLAAALADRDLTHGSYYTDAIYYRLFLPYIMVNYDKTVYLDCDLVLEADVADLYRIDIGDNYLGAVKDVGMIIYKYNTSDLQYLPERYFERALPGVDIDRYFNSGVLLMNLAAFRENFTPEELIARSNDPFYLYPDQDGLNNIAREKTLLLDMSWNTMPYNLGTRSKEYIENYLPQETREEYDAARSAPRIIHYNMLEKPWLHPCRLDHELMIRFWIYAEKSPHFRDLILYHPTPFYQRKRREKIPYFERQAIVQLLEGGAPSLKYLQRDALICAGKYVITPFSAQPVKFETFDCDGQRARIQATISLGTEMKKHLAGFYFLDEEENRYPCALIPKGSPYLFGEEEIGREYVLRATVPLKGAPLTLRLRALVGETHIRMRFFNFSVNFPIDRLNPAQYFFIRDYALSFRDGTLRLDPCDVDRRIDKERRFVGSLLAMRRLKAFLAALIRLPAMFVKKHRRRPVWIIGDNYLAADNGLAFFRYMQTRREVKTYFAVGDPKSEIAQKVRRYGPVVGKYTRRFQWLMLTSEASVSSVADLRLIRPFANDCFRDILARRKFVFLQHGVTTQDQSREHNRFVYNPALFCTCAKAEYRELTQPKYFFTGQVKLTGFPRFDYLYHDEKKVVTIMPTWRKYYHGDYGAHTPFFRFYDALLHDPRLQEGLRTYGYTLRFKPHPTVLLKGGADLFRHGENDPCFEQDDKSYAETYAESDLIVTDYSSAVFDFLYLDKPVLYAQFDADEFFSGKHVYEKGYIDYEVNGFGEVEKTVEGTVDRILEYLRSGCALKPIYRERIDDFFAYRDRSNGMRVYREIRKVLRS